MFFVHSMTYSHAAFSTALALVAHFLLRLTAYEHYSATSTTTANHPFTRKIMYKVHTKLIHHGNHLRGVVGPTVMVGVGGTTKQKQNEFPLKSLLIL